MRCLAVVGLCMSIAAACASGTSTRPDRGAIRRVRVDFGTPPLIATLTLATSGRSPVIVLLSGSGPSDQDETIGPNKPFRDLADGLAAKGVATLRYDKRVRQFPASVDPRTFTATDEYVPDALAAISALQARDDIDPNRIFILGHSEGGTLAPKIAAADPKIAGVILMAASTESFGTALVRQATYLSTLPDPLGARARAQLSAIQELARAIESPDLSPSTRLDSPLLGGAGPAYILDLRAYNELAVAASLRQPILILQGERDYQVTVDDDFNKWIKALSGRTDVKTHRYPQANHLFIDGTGPPSPQEYEQPGHVEQQVIDDIAGWVLGQTAR